MNFRTYLILSSLVVFLIGCKNSNTSEYTSFNESLKSNQPHPGKKLMEANCYVCHSPTADHDTRIGPPMVAIKRHYINENTSKEQFIHDILNWVKNPKKENARMPGAVNRFGVMPKTPFPEETIKQIADYLFDHDIEQPKWFEEHFIKEKAKHEGKGMGNGKRKQMRQQRASNNFQDLTYAERGLEYALNTKAVLGKNLMETIQKKGTIEAIEFCNERAGRLTDSMSRVYNAKIKRVTDKPRNSKNQANRNELENIETFKDILKKNQELRPIIEEDSNGVHVYYPITTNSMCLQCHGKPGTAIKPKTLAALKKLYQNDKATGYDIHQVRGIWSITFNKNK